MKKSLFWVPLLLVFAHTLPSVHAEGLTPFAPHANYRTVHKTLVAVKKAGHYDEFVHELTKVSSNLTAQEVASRLKQQHWKELQPCPGCRYEFAGITRTNTIGYLERSLQPGETLVCIDRTACFSTYCGNITKIIAPRPVPAPPPKVEVPCDREGYVAYTTSTVHAPTPNLFGGGYFTPFAFSSGGTSIDTTASHHQGWVMCIPSTTEGDHQ